MGADFVCALCRVEVAKDVALERLSTLTPEDIVRLWDEDEIDEGRDYLAEARAAVETVFSERRDTGAIQLKGCTYIITGGMAWGDDPTDSYADICKADLLGVTLPDDEWHDWVVNCVTN